MVSNSDVIAYIAKKDEHEELIPRTKVKEYGNTALQPVFFDDELGKRLFYSWVCRALELGVKRISKSYLLGGCSWTLNEIRLDIYTFNDSINDRFIKNLLEETTRLLSQQLRIEKVEKNDLLQILKEKSEVLIYEVVKDNDSREFMIVKDDGNVSVCLDTCVEQSYDEAVLEYVNQSMVHWRGDEKSFLLTRLHIRAFPSKKAKDSQAELEREYSLRDHVILGRELDLFLTDPSVGAGLILWAPNGAIVRKLMEEFEYKLHLRHGYQPVVTPHLATSELFETSGHLSYYRENMYVFDHDGKTHVVKPMNCPFHILIFKRKKWSYKELPVRYFEFGTVYRYERAGTLHGLTRVRGLTQDDSHIFLRPDQIQEEISRLLDLLRLMYSSYGINNYSFKLSLRDPNNQSKYIGSAELWEKAEKALEEALINHGIPFKKEYGEAAFYGPKIDIYLKDSLGREWQCGTIQLDFNLPERFNITYVDQDNKEKRVVIIHRALIGSIERFLGILLEYYAGRLPLWLAPVQVALLPVDEHSEEQRSYTLRMREELINNGIRAEAMMEGRLQARVREARKLRIPLIVVIGEKELRTEEFEAQWIKYGVDEKGRYKPVEEKITVRGIRGLVEWIKEEVGRETHGIIK
ncbi:MAG: threonine--tRNA ligase [Fervidicoccaceae archaeon]|nr:threonine--tRNA ligase [Fervidicoccaceae archaeon]